MLVDTVLQVYRVEAFKENLERLNRRARKVKLPEITAEFGQREQEQIINEYGEKEIYFYYPVLVRHYALIALPDDWRLAAVLDHKEGLNKIVPGEELPIYYRDRGPVCDHCGLDRNRNTTYVMRRGDGHNVQVGSTCLGDYFGIDPVNVLAQIAFFSILDSEEFDSGRGEPDHFALNNYLAHVSLCIRLYGWMSRGAAYEKGRMGDSTADRAWINMLQKNKTYRKEPTDDDKSVGIEVAEWMESLNDRSNLNDYMHNLAVIGLNGYVTHQSAGFAASAINAMRKEIEDRDQNANLSHIGHVKGKFRGEVELITSYRRGSAYGPSYFHKFLTPDGNIIMWSTATQLDPGKYMLEGTIKAHDWFNNKPQTIITRGKAQEILA